MALLLFLVMKYAVFWVCAFREDQYLPESMLSSSRTHVFARLLENGGKDLMATAHLNVSHLGK